MRPFIYETADSPEAAAKAAMAIATPKSTPPTEAAGQFLAGGTTMLDLMKIDVMHPRVLVDINGLGRGRDGRIETGAKGIRLGALVRMADAADHEDLKRDYPVLAQSLMLAASAQLRNMASLGGNILQRTRCPYFRDTSWAACNKRNPGSGCSALEGVNRLHAVLGASDTCIAAYPGDFAPALVALDASVETVRAGRETRIIPVAKLHRIPSERPELETVLAPGELITAITVPAGPWTRRSLYLKIRDRESYEFAVASAAVALDMAGGTVREARIALGGVATVPWRAREAEAMLRGKALDEDLATKAAAAAFDDARPAKHNAFKVPLGQRTIVRALLQASRMEA